MSFKKENIVFIHETLNGDHLSCYYGLAVITIARKCCFMNVNIHLTRQVGAMQIHTALHYLH